MKLTKSDIKYLKEYCSCDAEDIRRVQKAIPKTIYTVVSRKNTWGFRNRVRVSPAQLLKMIDRKDFLSGISRSTLHWHGTQFYDDIYVEFDSSNFIKEEQKKGN